MSPTKHTIDNQIVVIAVGFIAIPSLAVWYLVVLPAQQWQATQHWLETPAWIEEVTLAENRSQTGITYSSAARYRYEVAGVSYTGSRVSLYGPEDGTSYHRALVNELSSYRDRQKPFRCYVNPADPSDALLYRDIRWGMMAAIGAVALLFAGVGCAMLGQQIRRYCHAAFRQHP